MIELIEYGLFGLGIWAGGKVEKVTVEHKIDFDSMAECTSELTMASSEVCINIKR